MIEPRNLLVVVISVEVRKWRPSSSFYHHHHHHHHTLGYKSLAVFDNTHIYIWCVVTEVETNHPSLSLFLWAGVTMAAASSFECALSVIRTQQFHQRSQNSEWRNGVIILTFPSAIPVLLEVFLRTFTRCNIAFNCLGCQQSSTRQKLKPQG